MQRNLVFKRRKNLASRWAGGVVLLGLGGARSRVWSLASGGGGWGFSGRLSCFIYAGVAVGSLLTFACSKKSSTGVAEARGQDAQKEAAPIRFSGIPDSDKAKLKEQYKVVSAYLQKKLGRRVEYVHMPDYTAAVTALAAGKIDMAWLGGVTAVQAKQQTQGKVEFVAARERDMHFRSYFIAHKPFAQREGLKALGDAESRKGSKLEVIAPALKKARFSFGAKASTSGHVMPRYFLAKAPLNMVPERDFPRAPAYQLQGGHNATLRAVSSGAVDMGVLNYATWESADAKLQNEAPVVAVTPEYVDYCILARESMGKASISALREALTSLSEKDPQQKAVLEAFSARRFVPAKASDWQGIEDVLTQMLKNKDIQ